MQTNMPTINRNSPNYLLNEDNILSWTFLGQKIKVTCVFKDPVKKHHNTLQAWDKKHKVIRVMNAEQLQQYKVSNNKIYKDHMNTT